MKPVLAAWPAVLALGGCAVRHDAALVERRAASLYGTREAAGALPPPPALGADPSLDDYVRFGMRNNPGLRAAFERWHASLERIGQASTLPDPVVSWSHFVEEVQTRTGPQRNRFGLAQTLPWLGKLRLRGEVEAAAAERQWSVVEQRRLALVRSIARAYHDYGYLGQAIRIAADSLELLRRFEPVVQRKIQAGGSQVDLLRLQVEIGKLENDVESLRERRPALSSRLSAAIGRDSSALLPVPEPPEPASLDPSREELLARVLQRNPELDALRDEVRRSDKRRELAALDGWPDLTLRLDYFETGSAVAPGVRGSGDDPIGLGVMFNVPIWRGKYAAAVREARRNAEAARRELSDRGNTLRADVELALYELEDAARQIALYRDTLLPRARQSFRVTRTAYAAGNVSLLDVIDAERVLLGFEMAYWRAVRDHEQSIADLEALTGGDLR